MAEVKDHLFKAGDNTLTFDGFPSDGEYIVTIRGGSFHSIKPRADLHDDLVKAADALADAAEAQFNKLVAWLHKPDAKKAMKSLEADDEFIAALTAYRKARGDTQ